LGKGLAESWADFAVREGQTKAVLFFYKRLIFIAEGVWEKNNFHEAKIASWDEIG
jgi:hypothetical protein